MRAAQVLRITVASSTLAATLMLGTQLAHADASDGSPRTGVTSTTGGAAPTPSPTVTADRNNPWD